MTTTKKMVFGSIAVCFALGTCAAEISGVTVRQRWPWSRLVDIDYVITDATQAVDIAVSAFNGSTPLTLSDASLSGDLYGVSGQGTRRIIWDPTQSPYTNEEVLAKFSVTLTPAPAPLYMILDLTNAVSGGPVGVEYVYEDDLRAGVWGAWVENPVTNSGTPVNTVIWTGVNGDDLYKTDKLVLRRIPAGSYTMGSGAGAKTVSLTKSFYAGVFEVTQRQWEWVMGIGQKPSYFSNATYYKTRPVENIEYNHIRGATNATPSPVYWPATGPYVSPASFMGKLRSSSGMTGFDLPTEGQWEYLCRAGTTTYYNDGQAAAPNDGQSLNVAESNLFIHALGRYKYNGGSGYTVSSPPSLGTALVGSFPPNAWGLYDMHGNLAEWCLDWYATALLGGADPKGPETGNKRSVRGGGFLQNAEQCASALSRNSYAQEDKGAGRGFRLVRTLP
ncbi:MAG: formylglycine-generating enzyme family protein [Kiritimatiellae bacterium]|nr:formylglycine-generating enzyme family protein [Kiritimatiellia bacterium]